MLTATTTITVAANTEPYIPMPQQLTPVRKAGTFLPMQNGQSWRIIWQIMTTTTMAPPVEVGIKSPKPWPQPADGIHTPKPPGR